WAKAKAAKVVLRDGLRSEEPHGLYFKEQVRRELVDRFGWQRVYQGGLRVFTTIDMPMQEVAEATIAEQIKSIEVRRAAWQARRAPHKKLPKNGATAPPPRRAGPPPAPEEAREERGPRAASARGRRAPRRSRGARARHRVRAGDGRRPRLRCQPLQPGSSSASPARIRFQAVRLRDCDRGRLLAGNCDRSPRRADRDRAGCMDAGG